MIMRGRMTHRFREFPDYCEISHTSFLFTLEYYNAWADDSSISGISRLLRNIAYVILILSESRARLPHRFLKLRELLTN